MPFFSSTSRIRTLATPLTGVGDSPRSTRILPLSLSVASTVKVTPFIDVKYLGERVEINLLAREALGAAQPLAHDPRRQQVTHVHGDDHVILAMCERDRILEILRDLRLSLCLSDRSQRPRSCRLAGKETPRIVGLSETKKALRGENAISWPSSLSIYPPSALARYGSETGSGVSINATSHRLSKLRDEVELRREHVAHRVGREVDHPRLG